MNSYVAKHTEPVSSPPTSVELFQSYKVNKVEITDIKKWLSKGIADLKNNPILSIIYGFVFAIVGIGLSIIARENPVFVASITASFLLIGPFLAIGLYAISRRTENKKDPSLSQSVNSINRNLVHIGLYAVTLGFIISIWVRLSTLVVGLLFNEAIVTDQGYIALFQSLISMDQGAFFVLGLFAVGMVFAIVAFITGVATLPMLMDKKVDIVTATSTSIRAVIKNPVVMAAWALTIAVIIGLGIASFFVGLIILMPLMSYASWHAYRDLVEDEKK